MRLLLDTHTILWWLFAPEKLSATARSLFEQREHELLWSVASTWEMAIKLRLGKLSLPADLPAFVARAMQEQGLQSLAVEHAHAAHVAALPEHHKDPFDRLLASQSLLLQTPIVSIDKLLDPYGVERIW